MALGTTVDAVVQRVRRNNLLSSRGAVYTLDVGGYTAGATQLVLAESFTHIGVGAILAIDYELFYVKSSNAGTRIVEVIPAYYGTVNANHAAGAVVEVDPRFPSHQAMEYAEQEIRSWGKELWRVTELTVPTTTPGRAFDLGSTGEVYFVLDARARPRDGSGQSAWNFSWTGNAWPHVDLRLNRSPDSTLFPSGYSITTLRDTRSSPGELRVVVAQPFDLDPFTSATDLVADVGLRPEWIDIIEYGIRWRALQDLVIARSNFRAGTISREAEEVQAVDVIRAASQAADMRQTRLAKAGLDLRADWTYRESVG